jgi:hypothetical protein
MPPAPIVTVEFGTRGGESPEVRAMIERSGTLRPEDGRLAIRHAADLLLDDILHALVLGTEDQFLAVSGLPDGYRHKIEKDLYRWSVAFTVAGLKLTRRKRLSSACVAESLAMYAILSFAAEMLQDGPEFGLPERVPEADALSWRDGVIEPLVEDTDFLFLYGGWADGIGADREEPLGASLGTENLAYEDWFRPFDGREGHPYFDEYEDAEWAGEDLPWS